MSAGIWNMLFGALAIALGASGKFNLMFTNSPLALVGVGVAIFLYGVFQLVRSRRGRTP